MPDPVAVVEEYFRLIDEFRTADDPRALYGRIDALIADDIAYANLPLRELRGKEEFNAWQREFAAAESMVCDIRRIAASGDWVLTERVDTWRINGVELSLALMGSMRVADGLIAEWRDYMPEIAAWRASGQMRDGFFEDWA